MTSYTTSRGKVVVLVVLVVVLLLLLVIAGFKIYEGGVGVVGFEAPA